jgi:phosphoribosyl-dephospho-CoA transferase
MDNKRLAVHDLALISDNSSLYFRSHPQWVGKALRRAPIVVVRRGQSRRNFVAVGVRGADRQQRYGSVISLSDVIACRTPESLAAERGWSDATTQIPAAFRDALAAVNEYCLRERLVWGPIGSVGYQLLTGISVITLSSDLDMMIRCHRPPNRDQIRMFDEYLRTVSVRIDVVLEGPCGGVAMREYLSYKKVLIKDKGGARIGSFIWQGG